MARRIERNFRGHFICAADCRWFRVTDIDERWRVSSIGDRHPPAAVMEILGAKVGEPQEIGYQRLYETMVFPLSKKRCRVKGCPDYGALLIESHSALRFDGYMTQADAELGHEAMVRKVMRWKREAKHG